MIKFTHIFLIALLPLMTACHGGKNGPSALTTVYSPVDASGFTIYADTVTGSSIIEVKNPWQGADSITSSLFIARDGAATPEGFSGKVINGDARRIVAMSSTYVAMLDALDAADLIVGVSGIDFISSEAVASRRDKIADVGYDTNVDYESLVAVDPDIVLLYGVTGASPMEAKLNELNIPYLYIGDYVEESPLGKAEWIIALGELTGRRAEATERFLAIKHRYDSIAATISRTDCPKVMINAPYGDSWFMPSPHNYMARLISDAGGDYIYKQHPESTSSTPIDTEEAYMLARDADVWINPGMVATFAELAEATPRFMDIDAVKNRRVYNNNARTTPGGGNDFYESRTVNPDKVLADLAAIFHPTDSAATLTYYRQLR